MGEKQVIYLIDNISFSESSLTLTNIKFSGIILPAWKPRGCFRRTWVSRWVAYKPEISNFLNILA